MLPWKTENKKVEILQELVAVMIVFDSFCQNVKLVVNSCQTHLSLGFKLKQQMVKCQNCGQIMIDVKIGQNHVSPVWFVETVGGGKKPHAKF